MRSPGLKSRVMFGGATPPGVPRPEGGAAQPRSGDASADTSCAWRARGRGRMPRGVPTRLRGTAGRAVKAQTPGRGRGEEGRGEGRPRRGRGSRLRASSERGLGPAQRRGLRRRRRRPPPEAGMLPARPPSLPPAGLPPHRSHELFPGAAAHEGGARRERRREAASAAARFPPAPSGGGAALTCRAATLGLRGALAASAHVHAGHLRHQLPQRRLNGSELQPPPPLPPPPLRRSRAAPARRPLALGRTNCSPRWGWRADRRGPWPAS